MAGWQRPGLDPAQLEQYLVRIGASEEVCAKAKHKQADLELLSQIVGLQVRSVPFENLNLVSTQYHSSCFSCWLAHRLRYLHGAPTLSSSRLTLGQRLEAMQLMNTKRQA